MRLDSARPDASPGNNRPKLERYAWTRLTAEMLNPVDVRASLDRAMDTSEAIRRHQSQLDALTAEITVLEKRIRRATEEIISADEESATIAYAREIRKKAEQEVKAIRQSLAAVELQKPVGLSATDAEAIMEYAHELRDGAEDMEDDPAGPSPAAVAAASPAVPQEQTLQIGRTNAYRGLEVTVEEARSVQQVEKQKADRGKTIVALRVRLHNPSPQRIHFAGTLFHERAKLRIPGGATPAAMATDPFIRPRLDSEESTVDWLYFQIDRPVPLSELALALGGPQETIVTIPFSGPEPAIAVRSFEYLRSLDPIHDLIWSVSGGEMRLDIPMQQANPNQEFIVLRIRATNVSTKEITAGPGWGVPPEATQYLRVRADNGVLPQVSSAIHELPEYFPPKAEQDSIYAWQLPKGSKNPKLVILEADGSEHEIELGPLPPP